MKIPKRLVRNPDGTKTLHRPERTPKRSTIAVVRATGELVDIHLATTTQPLPPEYRWLDRDDPADQALVDATEHDEFGIRRIRRVLIAAPQPEKRPRRTGTRGAAVRGW
jgi:hypothetical protein